MLHFTHEPKRTNNYIHQLERDDELHPITITNAGSGKPKLLPYPQRSQKQAFKTHSNFKTQNKSKEKQSIKKDYPDSDNKPWSTQPNNFGLFDNGLKKNTLAAEERQIRAESKVQANQSSANGVDWKGRILSKEKEIQNKKKDVISKEQDKEIERLKNLIEKERREKERNDREYEEKKRQIEEERKQLIAMEREIERNGPKETKEVRQKIKAMTSEYPSSDKVKLKQEIERQNPNTKIHKNEHITEITQSESLTNQKNKIRQQQLEYLVGQRERNHNQYQKNTLGYSPTLIPLLSRASYKIISTQISSLVELLIDDMLEEQVYMLEAIELEEKAARAKDQERQIMIDYVEKLENFVDETEEIEGRLGQYNQIKFEEIYKPPRPDPREVKSLFSYTPQIFKMLESTLQAHQVEEIEQRVDRFRKYVKSFDEYKTGHLDMFTKVTEELIDEAIHKMAQELDNGAGEFVNIVFRNEFD